jgi:DNA-binding SARP family transcriptional activator
MDRFWRQAAPDSARNCLNVTLHGLRRLLRDCDPEHRWILFQEDSYLINPELDFWVDRVEFEQLIVRAGAVERKVGIEAAVPHYERAVGLYGGDFMEEDPYEDWTVLDRESLRDQYLEALDRLSEFYFQAGEARRAISLCQAALAKDRCHEAAHRRLMRCYRRLGYRDRALRQFQALTAALQTELEVEPSRRSLDLYESLRQDRSGASIGIDP